MGSNPDMHHVSGEQRALMLIQDGCAWDTALAYCPLWQQAC
jgi:hypothetical protein